MSAHDWLSQGTLVLASNNTGKIAEFEKMFAELNLPVEVIAQGKLDIEDAIEDGLSFVENAIIKARHAARISGKPAIADDSGICVPRSGTLNIAGNHFDFTKTPSDKAIRDLRRNVGMVFQQYNLWPHLTVQQNLIEAPCRVLGLSKDQALARAEKLLERLRLKPYSDRYPLHLSGGQQQRVAIARALMMEPQVLLFDEPTAALDPEITAQIVSIIRELAETNITQVIVTHEVEVARKTASRVVYMENGHIVEQGDASCFTEPQTEAFKNYLSH